MEAVNRVADGAGMAAWRNECAGWLALGDAEEARGIYEVGRYEGLIWARPLPDVGVRLPVMVLVEETTPGGTTRALERLRLAVDTFGLRGTSLYLALPPEGDIEPWRDAALALGFRHESVQVLMACPLPRRGQFREPARFDIAEAKSDKDWHAALDIIGEVYDDSPRMASFYNPRHKVRLFLARVNNEPVSVAALWPFAGAAGIYSVGTKMRYRGLGLAYALVEYVLETARNEGFPLATLRTTGDLLAVYFRHGFGVVGQVQRYRLNM